MTKEISFSCMHFIIAYEKIYIFFCSFHPKPEPRNAEKPTKKYIYADRLSVYCEKNSLLCELTKRRFEQKNIILRRPRLLLRWYKQMSVFCRLNVFCIIIVIKYELISFSVFHEIRFMLAHTCTQLYTYIGR